MNRGLRGDLIEMYIVMCDRESINWVKLINLRKNVKISGPAANILGNFLKMRKDSLISRIRNIFFSWATIR